MIDEKIGRYTIVKTVGSGSIGTVYKAEDRDGTAVAVKVVRSHVLYDRERRERFLQGVLAASEVRHKSVCPVLEIGDDEDDFFVITPFLKGVTLRRRLAGRPLPWRESVATAIEVAEILAAIHEAGTFHGGVSAANVWLQPDGSLILNDCGLARCFERSPGQERASGSSDAFIPMGASSYLSPEQSRGETVDHRTDVFSFGVLLYEMLTGSHPFEARNLLSRLGAILILNPETVRARAPSVPQELEALVMKALEKSPAQRQQTMQTLIAQLRAVQTIEDPPAAPPLPEESVRGSGKRGWTARRWAVAAACALAAGAVASALYFF